MKRRSQSSNGHFPPPRFLHCTVALKTHWRGRRCNTILAWGVRSTVESLGAYLFAGAFRYLASVSVGAILVVAVNSCWVTRLVPPSCFAAARFAAARSSLPAAPRDRTVASGRRQLDTAPRN